MSSRTEKLRRKQRRKEKKRQWLAQRGTSEPTLVVNPAGAAKMSEVLMQLVEPEWDPSGGEEALKKLLTIGMLAWNAALFKGDRRREFLADLDKEFPPEQRAAFQKIVDFYIRRKETWFPDLDRPIIDFELDWPPGGEPHLVVLSGLAQK